MSDYSITAVDYTALPAAMLDQAKRHMRVDFPDDDDSIKDYLQFALAYCERFSGARMFGADVDWSPKINATASRYQTPVQPIDSFKVMSGGSDVSSEYAIEAGDPVSPVWLVHSDGSPFPADAEITLKAGFTDPAKMNPIDRGNVLRVAATLYENRESISTLSLEQIPWWLNDMLGTWIPRI